MKKVLSVLLCAVILLSIVPMCVTAESVGTTYYIDSENGSDANSGTKESEAWQSVNNISSVKLGVGDKILFKRSQTHECTNLTINACGTPENPVVISSYGDGENARLNTNERAEVLRIFDSSYVTVSGLEITAHNGGGIWIDTPNKASYGITLDNLKMHDMQNYKVTSRDNLSAGAAAARASVMIKGLRAGYIYPVDNLTITNCEMYDVGNGISLWGSYEAGRDPWNEREDSINFYFNKGTLVENCYFHDMDAEAIIVGICDGALVTNCRMINCCQGEGVDENGKVLYYTAAAWFWGAINSTISYCEIAGQKNRGDGMTVDFDSYTNNCTYEYIYSHDNMRFMVNNAKTVHQYGNTVRYCLSVNDYAENARSCLAGSGEYNFNFYNNTIVGCGNFNFDDTHDSLVANNIFVPAKGVYMKSDLFEHMDSGTKFVNNCYYNVLNPFVDFGSTNVNPGFAGTDYADPESFKLSKDSPLIGAGHKVTDGQTKDFFGNDITSTNIGCYGGQGTDDDYENEFFIMKIIRLIKYVFNMFMAI